MRDELLRDALRRAVSREPAAPQAYAHFQRRLVRGTRLRAFGVAALGLSTVTALVLAFPVGGPAPQELLIPPTPQPNALRYTDRVAGFELAYPAAWHAVEAPGDRALVRRVAFSSSREYPALHEGRDPSMERPTTPYVEVSATRCAAVSACDAAAMGELASQEAAGASVTRDEDAMGPWRAQRVEISYPSEPGAVSRDDAVSDPDRWCAGCLVTWYRVDPGGDWVIDVRVVRPAGMPDDDAHAFEPVAARLVGSIAALG